jgi:hypothetical protein
MEMMKISKIEPEFSKLSNILCPFTERGLAPLSGVNPKDWGFYASYT